MMLEKSWAVMSAPRDDDAHENRIRDSSPIWDPSPAPEPDVLSHIYHIVIIGSTSLLQFIEEMLRDSQHDF
jgi:hypothetical protein